MVAGVVVPVLRKLGVDPGAVRQTLAPALDALPTLSGTAPAEPAGGSGELTQVLRDAEKEMRRPEGRVPLNRAPAAGALEASGEGRRGAAVERRVAR